MQEISEVLIKAREEKGIDLEQAARDTNISKMFLHGFETDNYEDFPAETYVLGFLRNYAAYLELDPEEIIKLYKQTKLQESEIPQEIILNKKNFHKKSFFVAIAIIAGIVLVGGVAVFVWTRFFSPSTTGSNKKGTTQIIESTEDAKSQDNKKTEVISKNTSKNYEITETRYENRFFEGDSFSIKVNEQTYTFKIAKATSQLQLETEELGTQIIKLGETLKLDLNNDTIIDIDISLGDIDKTDASKGVLLLIATGEGLSTNENATLSTENTNYTTIFEGPSAYPVTMNITFRNYCFFRYEVDRGNRKEKYYQKNATLSLRADNGFRIWASNGNAIKIELVGAGRSVELELTKPGEVIVQDIKWIKDEASKQYKFVVMNVD